MGQLDDLFVLGVLRGARVAKICFGGNDSFEIWREIQISRMSGVVTVGQRYLQASGLLRCY